MACGLCSRVTDTYYRTKLHDGLLADSERRYHATPAGRPDHQIVLEDGWVSLVGSQDPIIQLLTADYRRELSGQEDLSFPGSWPNRSTLTVPAEAT